MAEPSELRVMSYNVSSLRGDISALGSVVQSCAPDVLLVQEVPRFLRWRSKRAALARHCGLVVATADRPGGLCVMTALRVDLIDSSFSLLPKTSGREQRSVVSATVAFGGVTWRVMSLQLGSDASERARHVPALSAVLSLSSPAPLIVGAGLNEEPGGPVFSELAGRLQDCFAVIGGGPGATAPATSPTRRVDAIFADPALTVVSCETVDVSGVASASKHLPVLAVLRQ